MLKRLLPRKMYIKYLEWKYNDGVEHLRRLAVYFDELAQEYAYMVYKDGTGKVEMSNCNFYVDRIDEVVGYK